MKILVYSLLLKKLPILIHFLLMQPGIVMPVIFTLLEHLIQPGKHSPAESHPDNALLLVYRRLPIPIGQLLIGIPETVKSLGHQGNGKLPAGLVG
jgi:hypothetical protein